MSVGITCNSTASETLLIFDGERVVSVEELTTIGSADEAIAAGVPALYVINFPGQWRGTEFVDWLRSLVN